jgi:hypothetical protein
LTDATRNSAIQTILGKTATGRHEYSHLPLRGISRNGIDKGVRLSTQKKAGKWIPEYLGPIQRLVRGSLDGRPQSGTTGLSVLHAGSFLKSLTHDCDQAFYRAQSQHCENAPSYAVDDRSARRSFHDRAHDETAFCEKRVAASLSELVFDVAFPCLAKSIAEAAPDAFLVATLAKISGKSDRQGLRYATIALDGLDPLRGRRASRDDQQRRRTRRSGP